jgi:hypothetical protein
MRGTVLIKVTLSSKKLFAKRGETSPSLFTRSANFKVAPSGKYFQQCS